MLIAMAVFATEENGRLPYLRQTLYSISQRVNFERHRLFLIDNGSCYAAVRELVCFRELDPGITLLQNETNRGTAVAINRAWRERKPGEACVKMDDDVVISADNWPDYMENVFAHAPTIGICGLKRKDCDEAPWAAQSFYRSRLELLKTQKGERWLPVEYVGHVMGTCQAYSAALLDAIGYLYQMQDLGNLYGFDDALASYRAHLAGYETVFLPGIEIDHVDPGQPGGYSKEKAENAGKWLPVYERIRQEYRAGTRPLYWKDPQA